MTWAVVDGCFVVADILSLAAIQPEGAVAAEAVRTEVKAAARESVRSIGRELVETGSESAGKSLAGRGCRRRVGGGCDGREMSPASSPAGGLSGPPGGLYQVLQRLPEALPRMSLAQVAAMARPLCAKAGMRLSTWRPIQLLREGVAVPFRIPPERGLKYLAAQMAAGVRRRCRLSQDGRAPGLATAPGVVTPVACEECITRRPRTVRERQTYWIQTHCGSARSLRGSVAMNTRPEPIRAGPTEAATVGPAWPLRLLLALVFLGIASARPGGQALLAR